jgi:hypothetical protein
MKTDDLMRSRENTWPRSNGTTITLGELEDTAAEVAPKLWQGGRYSAAHTPVNFDVVVNLTPLGRSVGPSYTGLYIEWPIEDACELPDPTVLHPLVDLLAELSYQGKTILVHCQAGLNRSGLVCALVLRARSVPADNAIAAIRQARDEFALCNADFEKYVLEWAV